MSMVFVPSFAGIETYTTEKRRADPVPEHQGKISYMSRPHPKMYNAASRSR
jgi:hypothetical protein